MKMPQAPQVLLHWTATRSCQPLVPEYQHRSMPTHRCCRHTAAVSRATAEGAGRPATHTLLPRLSCCLHPRPSCRLHPPHLNTRHPRLLRTPGSKAPGSAASLGRRRVLCRAELPPQQAGQPPRSPGRGPAPLAAARCPPAQRAPGMLSCTRQDPPG
jgi:hypothetical protein